MRRVGQARRRDLAEPDIVDALQAVGAEVWRVSGKGLPDLLVRCGGPQGRLFAFEVKTGKAKRTDAQVGTQFDIVRSPAEALERIGIGNEVQ